MMLTDPNLNLERAYVDYYDVADALMSVYVDPERAKVKAERAIESLKGFTWEFAADKFIKWLED